MGTRLKQIPERTLARLWSRRAARSGFIATRDGRRFRLLYPGRKGAGAGPDFRDALLEMEGVGLVRGDVEVHVAQQQWRSHGHGLDPRYNGVVMHLVVQPDEGVTTLAGGARVPVVTASELMKVDPAQSTSVLWALLSRHGYSQPQSLEEWAALLERAGDERFAGKSGEYSRLLREEDPEQLLYESLMEALGYRSNKGPFLELAHHLPYTRVRRLALSWSGEERVAKLEKTLLETSGLLAPEGLEHMTSSRGVPRWRMEPGSWHLSGVRPANHPRRRLAGAVRLLCRHLEKGLLSSLASLVLTEEDPKVVTRALIVPAQGNNTPVLVGKGRAGDMVVNVVLPFCQAWAALKGDAALQESSMALYHRHPSLQDNEIIREMRLQLLPQEASGLVKGARRQQGLIHLQRLLAGARG